MCWNICIHNCCKEFSSTIYATEYKNNTYRNALYATLFDTQHLYYSICVNKVTNPLLFKGVYLTHLGRVTHAYVSKLNMTGSDNGLSPDRHKRRYPDQCWNIVNWALRNKFQWNLNPNAYIFIHEYAFENVVREMTAILSWPQYVNTISIVPFITLRQK